MVRDSVIAHRGTDSNWRDEAKAAMQEIQQTLDSGQYTMDDWIVALS
jgi:hypothetical protein